MVKKLKPLIPRVVYSKNGTVTILRIPAGTPTDIAEAAKERARSLAGGEKKAPKPFYLRYKKKSRGQISLF